MTMPVEPYVIPALCATLWLLTWAVEWGRSLWPLLGKGAMLAFLRRLAATVGALSGAYCIVYYLL